MDKEIIKIANLTKIFYRPLKISDFLRQKRNKKQALTVLDSISLSIKQGSITALLGPNGAGKTTLLKIIATLIIADKGSVAIDNIKTGEDVQKIKSILGSVFSGERSFYWRLTGRQNLEFFATLYGLSKHETAQRINYFLDKFNITYADNRFDSYSAGMKRKFLTIRALLHNPKILLLDEPIKSLDYSSTKELKTTLNYLKQSQKTIIIASHNISLAQELCDNFIIVNQGKIKGSGNLKQLQEIAKIDNADLKTIYERLISDV